MKKRMVFQIVLMVVIVIMMMSLPCLAKTKYDKFFNKNKYWNSMESMVIKVNPPRILNDYVNLMVNENTLMEATKSLSSQRVKFVKENKKKVLLHLYLGVIRTINAAVAKGCDITDAQYVYVTGIIKDPKAQAATNGPEYEMEKMVFRQIPLYILWESYKDEKIVLDELNAFFDYADENM